MHRVIAERRDIRRFRPDPVPGRRADARCSRPPTARPSVGLMQPWRLIVVRDARDARSRSASSPSASGCARPSASTSGPAASSTRRSRAIVEAPLGICVCCDHGDDRRRGARPRHDPARPTSTAPPAPSRTCGSPRAPRGSASAGSASTGRTTCAHLLGMPARVGPDRLPVRRLARRAPGPSRARDRRLVGAAPARRRGDGGALGRRARPRATPGRRGDRTADRRRGRSRRATGSTSSSSRPAASARSRPLIERWAGDHGRPAAGADPRGRARAAPPTTATSRHGTSLFGPTCRAQVAAAAARGETAVGVLARARRARAASSPTSGSPARRPPACATARSPPARADMTRRPDALSERAARRRRSRPAPRWPRELADARRRLPRARRDRHRQHRDHRGARVAR